MPVESGEPRPPTVIEIKCVCGAPLTMRGKQEIVEDPCWSCMRTVRVQIFKNGVVRVFAYRELERHEIEKHQLPQQSYRIVWQGKGD